MRDPKPFTKFVADLAHSHACDREHSAYLVAQHAETLRSIARGLDRIHTQQCNGYRDEKQEMRDVRRADRLETHAAEIAALYGFEVYIQGDPRGLPLYLGYAGHMTANNYSTHGVAVPV